MHIDLPAVWCCCHAAQSYCVAVGLFEKPLFGVKHSHDVARTWSARRLCLMPRRAVLRSARHQEGQAGGFESRT